MQLRKVMALILAGYLGLSNGYLALFEDGKCTPVHIFPYRAQSYSATDVRALEQGIAFHNRSELTRLLEDYLS